MLELNERVGSEPKVVNEPEIIISVKEEHNDKETKKKNSITTEENDPENVQ